MYFLECEAKPISVMLPRRQKQELFSAILFPHCHHWELLTQCHLICHPNGSPHCEMHQRLRLRSRHNSKNLLSTIRQALPHKLTAACRQCFFFTFFCWLWKPTFSKPSPRFRGIELSKKVATAVNGFFIHVVSKLCIFCVKLSKNQSIRQKYNKNFQKRHWMIVYLLADKIINISKRIFGAFCWRGPPIAGGQFSFAIPISRLISAIKFRSNFRKKFSFLKIDFFLFVSYPP